MNLLQAYFSLTFIAFLCVILYLVGFIDLIKQTLPWGFYVIHINTSLYFK